MVYKPRKFNRSKRYKKKGSTLTKKIKKQIFRMADKKFHKVETTIVPTTLPTYNTITNPFSYVDLCQIGEGITNQTRLGQRITAINLKFRMSLILPYAAIRNTAFLRYYIIQWPDKNSASAPNDMHFVSTEIGQTGSSTAFVNVYNAAYNSQSAINYKVLKSGQVALVKDTATQLRTINTSFNLKGVVMDFGAYTGQGILTNPLKNNIVLYLACDNNQVQYSIYTKLNYVDL